MSDYIEFGLLSLKNFLSYGKTITTIDLTAHGSTIILGEDLDNTSNGQGGNGCGKYQSVNNMIKTPTDWIRMGDVKLGQMLQMPDGSVAPVTNIFPQGVRDLYEITFSDGRSTLAGGPHLWSVCSPHWDDQHNNGTKILTTQELIPYLDKANSTKNSLYDISIPMCVHRTIPNCELPIHPYLLGILLGDGCISLSDMRLSSIDSSIIAECSELALVHNQELQQSNTGGDWEFRNIDVSANHKNPNSIKSKIEELELDSAKSDTKFIPSMYMRHTSFQQKLDLLSGLLDSDCIVSKTKEVIYYSNSKQIALDVQYLIRSIGGKAQITQGLHFHDDGRVAHKRRNVAYGVSIQYKQPRQLFHLDRKLNEFAEHDTPYVNEGLRIVSITKSHSDECQCITVGHPDHLYITDDYIVTHNTVLINALTVSLFDKTIGDISKDNMINDRNHKDMMVSVEWRSDKTFYKVVRVRKGGKSGRENTVTLYERGSDNIFTDQDDITPDSMSNTNKKIESLLGFGFDLFCHIVVFSATSTPFLKLPLRSASTASQVGIIEGLFNITRLTSKAIALKDEISDTKLRVSTHEEKIALIENEHLRHNKQLKSANQRIIDWDNKNQLQIKSIEDKLTEVASVDIETQQKIHKQISDVYDIINDTNNEITALNGVITMHNKKIAQATTELKKLKNNKCPYCEQEFHDITSKVDENNDIIASSNEIIGTMTTDVNDIKIESDVAAKLLTNLQSKVKVKDIAALVKIASDSDNLKERLVEYKSTINPFIEPLEELTNITVNKIDYSKLNKIKKILDHQQFLLKLLTKKDSFVRKVLLSKNIPFLNGKLNGYLQQLGLPHKVEFTSQMTAKISRFGRETNFGNLSSGQRARVNLALSFAFRDVLQNMHKRINICMLDEALDVGLDAVGVQQAAKLLKHKATNENMNIFIITHRGEISSAFDHILTVQYRDGFSSIKK